MCQLIDRERSIQWLLLSMFSVAATFFGGDEFIS